MTGQEKRVEVKRLLLFIYQEWSKAITEDLISYWLEGLRGFTSLAEAWIAAKHLVRSKTYGEPKLKDLCEIITNMRKALNRTEYESYYDLRSPYLPTSILQDELRRRREHEQEQAVPAEIEKYVSNLSEQGRHIVAHGAALALPEYRSRDEAKQILGRIAPKLIEAA